MSMRFRIGWFIAAILTWLCGSLAAQLFTESSTTAITGIEDVDLEVTYTLTVRPEFYEDYAVYKVSSSLNLTRDFGRFLVPSADRFDFSEGGVIGSGDMTYTNASTGSTWGMPVLFYTWEVRFPGSRVFVRSDLDFFPNKTSILIGFARSHPLVAGTQYGWVRLERETTNTAAIFRPDGSERRIAFSPAGFAVHPIAGQPIRAGMAPELPQLVSEILPPEGEGPARVRVSWPPGLVGVHLERAENLMPPVQWVSVTAATGNDAVFEVPEDGQLYLRLANGP